jgi:hypothetical protein
VVHDFASGDRIWQGQIQDVVMQCPFNTFASVPGRADGINIITSSFMRLPSPLGESGIIFIVDNSEIAIGDWEIQHNYWPPNIQATDYLARPKSRYQILNTQSALLRRAQQGENPKQIQILKMLNLKKL